ncbi:MAG: ferredoxin--nitrite reductase [Cyanophyceae cyanobacterium]
MSVASDPATKLNRIEKAKAEKHGLAVLDELEQFAKSGWEAIDKTDLEMRLKWLGIFFRPVTPGKFMVRLRIPSGCITSPQLRVLADAIGRYGTDGTADITTRQNIQLRGLLIEDIPELFRRLQEVGLTSLQSGMDNVRNLTSSPVAGIDPDELIDTRDLAQRTQDAITAGGKGSLEFSNLPRKLNIAFEGARDNSIHAEINDIAFVPAYREGELGFNVLVGGYLSAQRCVESIAMDVWVPPNDEVVDLCCAMLRFYDREGLALGLRENRAKARLWWAIEKLGVEGFRAGVEAELGRSLLRAAPEDEIQFDKRDHLGVHPQKQAGYSYVGVHVPMGRLTAEQMYELARLAETYGQGELRLTVEQNAILPWIPDDRVEALLSEPLLTEFQIAPPTLTRSVISCTGKRYCNFALVETKGRALAMAQLLDQEFDLPERVRMHWTGCPNSCGQAQAGDIGFIGTKVRKDGQVLEGVDVYLGGKVGKGATLGELHQKGVACEDLPDLLRSLLVERFGATPKG